jgi:pimeloyl-ACP methyl ester carboxylesterase
MNDVETAYRSIWTHMMQVPFTQGYITVSGIRTRYVEAGEKNAPGLVLLHGTGGHWEAFCANIGDYAKNFHVFSFDMKGAGFADKPDVDYEIKELATFAKDFTLAVGLKKASFIGVSLGAWTAARVAIDYPEITEKIILISPVGTKRLSPIADGDSENQMQKRLANVRDTSWESTKTIFKGLIHDENDIIPDLIKIRQTIHRLPNAADDMKHVMVVSRADVYERGALTDEELKGLKAKTLVFVSENDMPFFKAAAKIIAELVPNAKLIELSNVAHWAQFESPGHFNEVTTAFLLDN